MWSLRRVLIKFAKWRIGGGGASSSRRKSRNILGNVYTLSRCYDRDIYHSNGRGNWFAYLLAYFLQREANTPSEADCSWHCTSSTLIARGRWPVNKVRNVRVASPVAPRSVLLAKSYVSRYPFIIPAPFLRGLSGTPRAPPKSAPDDPHRCSMERNDAETLDYI